MCEKLGIYGKAIQTLVNNRITKEIQAISH